MALDRGRGIAVKYRIALAFVATSCMAGMAFAADLPVSGPYGSGPFIVRQPVEWTGFYFGANAGYGSGRYSSNMTFTGLNPGGTTTPFGLGSTELSGTEVIGSGRPSGAIAGGQIGFNWQAGMFVFGGEIDGQWSGQENTFTTSCEAGCTATQSIRSDRSRPGADASVWLSIGSCLT
jgi:outer membrane immunogenic protein